MNARENDKKPLAEITTLPHPLVTKLLAAGYATSRDVILASDFKLLEIDGIGPATLAKVRKAIGTGFFWRDAKAQAKFLGIPYEKLQAKKDPHGPRWLSQMQSLFVAPEIVALEHYQNEGWQGHGGEGYVVTVILNAGYFCEVFREFALARCRKEVRDNLGPWVKDPGWAGLWKSLKAHLPISYGSPTHAVYIHIDLELRRQRPEALVSAIVSADEERMRRGLRQMFRYDKMEDQEPLDEDFVISVWKALSAAQLEGIASRRMQNIGYVGWPDLTLVREKELKFIEVKTTDRLHESQLDTYLNVAAPLGLNFGIIQLHPR